MKRRIELELTDPQIAQLRAIMDGLPLNRYAPLVLAVLKKLPLESDAATNASDADRRAPNPQGLAGGFSLHALTPKGERLLPELQRMLGRLELPHGDSL